LQLLQLQQSSCKYLLHLIEDILDLSKFEFGKFQLEKKTFKIEDEVKDVIDILSQQSRHSGIQLNYTIDPLVPEKMYQDPKRLKRVMFNLVGNALKFTQEGFV